jgi:hypothetical protein
MSQTWVALGANSIRDYQLLVPFSALLWKERIGFHPIVLTCDQEWNNPRGMVTRRAMEEVGIDSIWLEDPKTYASHTLAQNCREFASCLPISDEDWIMPSDADLWPIQKEFYHAHEKSGARGTLYYANGDLYQTYPTCHVTLRARDWRALGYGPIGANITDKVEEAVTNWLRDDAPHWPWKERNFAIWMSDQALITDRLRRASWHDELKPVERHGHPPTTRIDRTAWRPMKPDDVDAHILRAPDEPENWPRILELFGQLLPQWKNWAIAYHKAYWEAYR